MRFDHHTIVLLVRPPDAPELSEEEAAVLQDAHLGHQAALHEQGHIVAAGPLEGQDDDRLRGITVLAVDPETARELYRTDPAVQAGRLDVEVMTWLVPAGNLRFDSVPHPRSMAEATDD
jgi:uncharacterized protein YciI